MIRTFIYCTLMGFALPGMAAQPAMFRFSKDVDRGAAQVETILGVVLDSDVYAATRPAFPDLRLFDAQGKETPYALERATEPRMHTVRTACASKVEAIHEHADGLDVLIRLDPNVPAADGLSILTPLTNYERRVHVYGSNDGAQWTPLVANRLVFDYSRYMDVSNRDVQLPKNSYRYLKVNIEGITDAKESPFLDLTRKYHAGSEVERSETTVLQRRPFRIDSIELWRESQEKLSENERKIAYKPAAWRVEEDADAKSTIINITTRREPLTELAIETSSRNFNRAAVVQMPVTHGVRTEWIDVGRGQLSLMDFGGFHKEAISLFFPEQREKQYRIVIRNEDNPPLTITGVTARGNVYRAVFLAAADANYRLCYGSEEAEQPSYDAAMVLASLRPRRALSEAQLGPEVASAAAGPSAAFTLRGIVNNAAVLGAVVVALVAILGWALYRAARRINEIPKE